MKLSCEWYSSYTTSQSTPDLWELYWHSYWASWCCIEQKIAADHSFGESSIWSSDVAVERPSRLLLNALDLGGYLVYIKQLLSHEFGRSSNLFLLRFCFRILLSIQIEPCYWSCSLSLPFASRIHLLPVYTLAATRLLLAHALFP